MSNLPCINFFLHQIFKDLSSDFSYQDNATPLHIHEDDVLGKGGFGFVCKGEIQISTVRKYKYRGVVRGTVRESCILDSS